jgi:hypothetical protein
MKPPEPRLLPSTGYLDDMYSFDPATVTWTLLSTVDDAYRPSARDGHGLTSAGGRLYLHGGSGDGAGVGRALGVGSQRRWVGEC